MTLARMPLSTWAWFITACIGLLAFADLLPACILLILDRTAGTSFFNPAGMVVSDTLLPHSGGSPLLWQHLFWFFGHPEVYIAIVPGFGIVSHILPAFTRKPLLGGMRVMIGCMIAIGFLSYMVWGHHMFVSGMNPFSAILFSVPTLIITIPATVATLMWLGSIYGANLRFTSASLFCLGFISVFISGGISGFFLAQPAIDTYLHATYFVVAHFHFVMAVAAIFGIFAATYFWMPKMIGRMMNETLGKLHFWLTFIGVYCIFMPMHYLGLAGNVRRYASFTDDYLVLDSGAQPLPSRSAHRRSPIDFLYNLIHTRWWGRLRRIIRGGNCLSGPPHPPPFDNFGGRHLVVHNPPYEYKGRRLQRPYHADRSQLQ
jgi:cytochrome c oxidase subunit 1